MPFRCQCCGQSALHQLQVGYDIGRYNIGYLCNDCYFRLGAQFNEDSHGHRRIPVKVKLFRPSKNVQVVGSNRQFGIELETSRCNRWGQLASVFEAKTDGSVSGLEFYSPPLKSDSGLYAVFDFLEQARTLGFEVNNACGFHLHVDMGVEKDTSAVPAVFDAYLRTHDMWQAMLPQHRRGAGFSKAWKRYNASSQAWGERLAHVADICSVLSGSSEEYCISASNIRQYLGERYSWVNFCSLASHGTLEVRMHQGTLNPAKVISWIVMHTRFIDNVVKMSKPEVARMFPDHLNPEEMLSKLQKDIFCTVPAERIWKKRMELYRNSDGLGLYIDDAAQYAPEDLIISPVSETEE